MRVLTNQKILFGVCGGIAAYKAAETVRLLTGAGAEVRVVMTESAQAFITPLTLQALSGHRVHTDLLDADSEDAMGHIELARWADLILVAPATANCLARLAHGLADDLLTTLCLASAAPLLLAPAMNQQMWRAEVSRANVRLLRERGVELLGPADGNQACGDVGPGRMLEPEQLLDAVAGRFADRALAGRSVLVTAGPTREAIDPVRYISNRSSGRMGFAVAEAAVRAGAEVTLVSGPVALPTPPGVRRHDVETARQMLERVLSLVARADIFIAAAAVADYRPTEVAGAKMKKSSAELKLAMTPTEDVLASVSALARPPFTVGFAAETDDLEGHARAKLDAKRLDMIAANRVGDGIGFEVADNALSLYWSGGGAELPLMPKTRLARELIECIADRWHAKNTVKDS